jgi:hypothetical protein
MCEHLPEWCGWNEDGQYVCYECGKVVQTERGDLIG